MAELPTGTVTFLFTNIEGSTRFWERHPEAMREALATTSWCGRPSFSMEAPSSRRSAISSVLPSLENVIIDRVLSVGSIAKLPQAERDRAIARVQEVIANTPELVGKP